MRLGHIHKVSYGMEVAVELLRWLALAMDIATSPAALQAS